MQNRFGSSPEIVGKSVLLNGESCVVVGVMPPNFKFPSEDVDVWQPLPISPASSNLGNHYLNLVGDLNRKHLSPGKSRNENNSCANRGKVSVLLQRSRRIGVGLIPLRQQMTGNVQATFWS